jgi:hypothetical protein
MYQLESIANILQAAGIATLGQDLFLYHAPAEVENCTILYPSNDPPLIDPDTPNYFIGKFQTIARNSTYEGGLVISKRIGDALTLFNTDTSQMFIKTVRPLFQPRVYRRGGSGILEFSVSYEIRFVAK